MIGAEGRLAGGTLALALASVPAVIGATLVAPRSPPRLSERTLRRLAFGLLIALGR